MASTKYYHGSANGIKILQPRPSKVVDNEKELKFEYFI